MPPPQINMAYSPRAVVHPSLLRIIPQILSHGIILTPKIFIQEKLVWGNQEQDVSVTSGLDAMDVNKLDFRMLSFNVEITAALGSSQEKTVPGDASVLSYTELRENFRRDWAAIIAEEPGRVIEMKFPYGKNSKAHERFENQLLSISQDPAHEAYLIFTEVYTKLKITEHEEIWVNLEKDILYFGPDSYLPTFSQWRPLKDGKPDQAAKWQSRGSWNHWRGNPANGDYARGEEEEGCDASFQSFEGYHPLLSDPMLEFQRSKIKNVAFHLEFWLETEERRSNGQLSLLRQFKGARNFFLGSGDVGERDRWVDVSGLLKDEHGSLRRRMSYTPRIARKVKQGGPLPPLRINTGEVRFLEGAIQTNIDRSQWNIHLPPNTEPYAGPLPVTMCVSRDGLYLGHKNRFETKDCAQRFTGGSMRKIRAVHDSKLSQGNLQYQVEWRGHHKLDMRWYPAQSAIFNGYQHVVDRFHRANPGKPSRKTPWVRKTYKRKEKPEEKRTQENGLQLTSHTADAQKCLATGDVAAPLYKPMPFLAQPQF